MAHGKTIRNGDLDYRKEVFMILLIIVILFIATCIFPYIWIIVPIAMVVGYYIQCLFIDEDYEKYKREKRLEECRRRRYGRRR